MKRFLIILGIALAVVFVALAFVMRTAEAPSPQTTWTPPSSAPPAVASTSPAVPFRGPTGPPFIVGPSGPPPSK